MQLAWFLVLVGLLAGSSYAFDEDCCSAEDRQEVEFMWHAAWHSAYTGRRVAIMREVWKDLEHNHPEANELLKKKGIQSTESPEFRAYMIKLVHALDNLINLMEEPLVLEEELHHIAENFSQKVGLKKGYFEAVIESLENVLPKVSTCFNAGAWHRCLNRLGSAITEKIKDA
jgi:hypothetical protein